MNAPRDAYFYIASLPPETLAFIEVELPNPAALSKIRAYLQKWRPIRLSLPASELDALGIPRGPKFDKILEQLFDAQLRGKAKTPEDRTKRLRQYAGIKEEPKKKLEKEKKAKGKEAEPPAVTKGKSPLKQSAPSMQGKPTGNAPPAAAPTTAAVAPNLHKPAAQSGTAKTKTGKRKAGER
jgi:hypothetical protein